jgi:hypothetical protein
LFGDAIKRRKKYVRKFGKNFNQNSETLGENFRREFFEFQPLRGTCARGGGVIATPDMMSGGTNFDLFIGYFSGSS